jgi:hypothetical protein
MSKCIGKDIANNMDIPLRELKHYIKPSEIQSIIKQYCIIQEEHCLINSIILQKIFDTVNNWVVGIKMSKLAGENKMDVFWDDDKNCMTFKNKE